MLQLFFFCNLTEVGQSGLYPDSQVTGLEVCAGIFIARATPELPGHLCQVPKGMFLGRIMGAALSLLSVRPQHYGCLFFFFCPFRQIERQICLPNVICLGGTGGGLLVAVEF